MSAPNAHVQLRPQPDMPWACRGRQAFHPRSSPAAGIDVAIWDRDLPRCSTEAFPSAPAICRIGGQMLLSTVLERTSSTSVQYITLLPVCGKYDCGEFRLEEPEHRNVDFPGIAFRPRVTRGYIALVVKLGLECSWSCLQQPR